MVSAVHPLRRSVLGLGAAVAAVAVVAAGCGTATPPEQAASHTDIVTAWPTDITTFYPMETSNQQDDEVAINTYEGLVGYTFEKSADGSMVYQGSQIAPALADSWDVGESSATFHLDPDRTFYPSGNPVTAADVKWSMGAALDSLDAQDIFTNGLQSADDVEVVDDHTVTFNFKDQQGDPVGVSTTTLAMFVNTNMSIIDSVEAAKHATADDPWATEWLRDNIVGTGPYYVSSWEPGQQLVLSAVPDHPNPPAFETVTARVVNDANMAALIQGGEINFAEFNISQSDLNRLDDAGVTVASEPAPMMTYLTMATDTGPFGDENVRRAVAYALPYEQVVDSVYFGRAERADSYVNPTSSSYTEAWGSYDTDIEKAQSLMAEAGSPQISVPLHYSTADAAQEDIAILIQDSLRQIGIDVRLTPHTAAEQWDVINGRSRDTDNPGPPDMVLFNWGPWTDDPKIPVGFATTTGGVNNYALWSNPRVDEINTEWEQKPSSAERDDAYTQAQEIVAAAAPLIPITYADRQSVLGPGITGATFEQFPGTRFYLLERVA